MYITLDEGCNNAECAYDSGDCGFSHFERIQHEKTLNLSSTFQSEKNFYYSLERGMTVVYWDLSNVFEKFKDIAIVPNTDSAIRQRYTYRVLQTIQMKHILLCVWAEPAVLGSTKTALKFKCEI